MLTKWVVCLLVLMSCELNAIAQFAYSGSGVQPYQSYDLNQIGAVNLYSGRLTVDIPLFDYIQAGKLPDLKVDLVMNSASWTQIPYDQSDCSGCVAWVPIGPNDPESNAQAFLGTLSYHAGGQYTWGLYMGQPNAYGVAPSYNYAQDYTGATHFFGDNETLDGTGIMSAINSTGISLIDKNGISDNSGCSQRDQNNYCVQSYQNVTDPNQNVITWNYPPGLGSGPTSITDSVGRSIPLFDLAQASVGCHQVGFPGPQGASASTIQVCISSHEVTTSLSPQEGVAQYAGYLTFIDSIELPSGKEFTFQYDASGDVIQIGLPSGGSIGFNWSTVYTSDEDGNADAYQTVTSRTLTTGATSETWTYDRDSNYTTTTVLVHDPDQNDTQHVFDMNGYEYETDYFQGAYAAPSGGGSCLANPTAANLIKTEMTCYTGTVSTTFPSWAIGVGEIPTQKTTHWQNGQTSTVAYQYDFSQTWEDYNYEAETGATGAVGTYTTGSLLSTATYDYGTGSAGGLLQKKIINYEWQTNAAYANANLLNIPSSVITQDGTQNPVSETDYSYDESNYGPSGARGNLTTTSQVLNTGSPIQTHTYFNTQGMPTNQLDASNNSTSISYQCNGALPHVVTNALGLQTTYGYDCNSGLPISVMDANNGTTTYGYDAQGDPTSVAYPDGGEAISSYTATQTSQVRYQNTSAYTDTETLYDGLGRVSRVAVYNGQASNPWYQRDTCYDPDGRISFQSYSYQGAGFVQAAVCSGSGDAYTNDALGRVTKVAHADGTWVNYSYQGRATQITDENGVSRIIQVDGLGRTTAVCEISSNISMSGTASSESPSNCGLDIVGTGFLTTYAYNLANHTTSVTQGAQTRTFQTDSLGRIIFTQEPESGQTTYNYSYNSTGLLVTRTRPHPNQVNPSVTTMTTTQYDALGRVLSVSYNDGTPNKTFAYDQSQIWGNSGVSTGAAKGRLTAATSSVNMQAFVYDSMGRVTANLQCLPTECGNGAEDKWLSYSYDWLGNTLSATDGAGITTSYAYSPANEVLSITSSANDPVHPPDLVSNVQNGPFGPLTWQLGNGLTGVRQYDVMGRVTGGWVCQGTSQTFCIGGGQIYGFTAAWSGDRVTTVWDTVLNDGANYGYDEFNRLTSRNVIAGAAQNFTYVYDRYGNRWQQNVTGGSGPAPNSNFNTANNQINVNPPCTTPVASEYCYDAAGNMTSDGFHTYGYDADGNVTQVDGGNTAAFAYNALNQRVQINSTGNDMIEFVFNLGGQRASVWDGTTGNQAQGQAYWGATPVEYYAGYAHFQHQDWLGTERVTTNYAGNVEGTYASLPFGDGFAVSAADNDPYHFAGLDHDYSSNTDHTQFRQYNNTQGRWVSPDPYSGSYDFSNPQSLNRYAYVLNNPLSLIDPTGTSDCTPGEYSTSSDQDEAGEYSSSDCDNWLALSGQSETDISGQGPIPLNYTLVINSQATPLNGCNTSDPMCQVQYQQLMSQIPTGPLFSTSYFPSQAPSNFLQYEKKVFSCNLQAEASVFKNDGVALGLDAAGFIPGEGLGAAAVQTTIGVASAFNSLYHQDLKGAAAGAAGEGLGITYFLGTAVGASWAKAIPIVGYGVNALATLNDLTSAYSHGSQAYKSCMSNP